MIENKKKKIMVQELIRKGFDPDPVKKWKATQVHFTRLAQEILESDIIKFLSTQDKGEDSTNETSDAEEDLQEDTKDSDYDYLVR